MAERDSRHGPIGLRSSWASASDGRQPRILLRVSPRRNAFRDLRAPQTAERYPLLVMARLTRILFRPPVSYSVPPSSRNEILAISLLIPFALGGSTSKANCSTISNVSGSRVVSPNHGCPLAISVLQTVHATCKPLSVSASPPATSLTRSFQSPSGNISDVNTASAQPSGNGFAPPLPPWSPPHPLHAPASPPSPADEPRGHESQPASLPDGEPQPTTRRPNDAMPPVTHRPALQPKATTRRLMGAPPAQPATASHSCQTASLRVLVSAPSRRRPRATVESNPRRRQEQRLVFRLRSNTASSCRSTAYTPARLPAEQSSRLQSGSGSAPESRPKASTYSGITVPSSSMIMNHCCQGISSSRKAPIRDL